MNLTAHIHTTRAREIDGEVEAIAQRIMAHPERYRLVPAREAIEAHEARAQAHRLAAALAEDEAHFDQLEEHTV